MKRFKKFLENYDPYMDPTHFRPDGSPKGSGWLGKQKNAKGQDVSEYSIGTEIDGQEMDIPTLVPRMTEKDKQEVLASTEEGRFPSDEVIGKAISHAQKQINAGESPFNEPEESINTPSKRKAQRYEYRTGMGDIAWEDIVKSEKETRKMEKVMNKAMEPVPEE